MASLTHLGVTVLMTAETEDRYTDLRFSSYGNAFLADAILMQRYIELHGRLRRVLSLVKVRGSAHSDQLHFFDTTDAGLQVRDTLENDEGILSGHPRRS